MVRSRGRRAPDLMLTTGSVCTVMAGMAAIDVNAREAIMGFIAGDHGAQLGTLASRAQGYSSLVVSTFIQYRNDHAVMMAFAVVALVLFVFMFRT